MITKGGVDLTEVNIGDILYEFVYGFYIKFEVITKPTRDDTGYWTWRAKAKDGAIIHYGCREGYAHYGPNLYDYMAYQGAIEV